MTTTTPHPLGLAVESAITALAETGDFAPMEALISEDAVLYAHCGGSMGGIKRGRDNCLGNFKNLTALVDDSLRLDVTQLMATDSFVVMLNRATAHRERELLTEEIEAVDIDQMIAVIWRFQDGKCVEFHDHFADVESWDAFWRFDRMPDRSGDAAAALTEAEVKDVVERISSAGDNTLLREFFSPDVVSYVDGHSPLGGEHVGIDAVLAGFGRVHELTGGNFSVVAEDVLVSENLATFFNRVTATRGGNTIEHIFSTTWRIERGHVVEVWVHFEDVEAWDAFWVDV